MTLRSSLRARSCILSLLFLGGCVSSAVDEPSQKSQGVVAATSVFISEFHYDNVGTDEGEAIELVGPAGTDLSTYSLVLYNGANGAVYGTQTLSGILGDEGGGFGTAVVNYPSNGLQNGSPDGIALVHGTDVVMFVSYEGTLTAVGGPADGLISTDVGVAEGADTPLGQSLQLVGTGTVFTDFSWTGPAPATFGALNAGQTMGGGTGSGGSSGSGGATGGGGSGGNGSGGDDSSSGCGTAATPIAAVQGAGEVSPLVGQTVSIEGVVVGDFQGAGAELGGFFVQAETPDNDPATSEGVFVYDPGTLLDVALGERVRVAGPVSEYFGLTQLSASAVLSCGTGVVPNPVPLELPVSTLNDFESREGMLVRVSELTVTETYNLGRYGEVALAAGGRLFNPTQGAGATADENARRRVLLDDGKDGQNLEPVPYLGSDGTLRIGDTLGELTAVLSYGFDVYRLVPLDPAAVAFTRDNPRPATPADIGGDLRIASLNVLNYFTTLGERGADTVIELERQRAKLVQTVIGLDADVLGLLEIENNSLAIDDFVSAINAALGSDVYVKAVDPTFTGTDAIRNAMIYKSTRVEALGFALSDSDAIHSRPPVAEAFSFGGNRFSVVVNHFKSKGSCPESADDPNADFGQGCWNALRTQQSQRLIEFVAELQNATNDPDVVVLGDLNAYLAEDPIAVLEASGLINLVRQVPPSERYSYVFNGESGTLDYALVTSGLTVSGATIWHINADEPRLLDYNTEFNPASAYSPDAFRSSDHDPVLLGLDFATDALALLAELTADTQELALATGLSKVQRLRLFLRLEVSEAALRLAERSDPRFPAIALAQRRAAGNQLHEFARIVEELASRGLVSASSAAELASDALGLAGLLQD